MRIFNRDHITVWFLIMISMFSTIGIVGCATQKTAVNQSVNKTPSGSDTNTGSNTATNSPSGSSTNTPSETGTALPFGSSGTANEMNQPTIDSYPEQLKVVQRFFQDLNDKKYDDAFSLLDAPINGDEQGIKNHWKHFISVKNLKISLPGKTMDGRSFPKTENNLMLEVQYDLTMDQIDGAEGPGHQTRFVILEKNNGIWKITALGTAL